jgi:hypothetical protein
MSVEAYRDAFANLKELEAAKDRLARVKAVRLPTNANNFARDLLTNLRRHAANLTDHQIDKTLAQIHLAAQGALGVQNERK